MIILDATTKSLEIILSGAITTNQLPWVVSYVDTGATPPLAESDGNTNSGSAVTMVSAPSAGFAKIVKNLTVYNNDTVDAVVTIRVNNNGTFRKVFSATMSSGDNLCYTDSAGWQVINSTGQFLTAATSGTIADHDHTSNAGDGGVLTNDEHDGYSDYTGITVPATPSAGHTRLYASTSQNHTRLNFVDQDGTVLRVCRDSVLLVRNTSGSDMVKGAVVDINGSTGQVPTIQLADADDPDKHAEGILVEAIANNAYGLMMTSGMISGLDTSGFVEGDVLYVSSTAGDLTTTPPAEPAFKQKVAVVTNSHATQGSIEVEVGTVDETPRLHHTTHESGGTDAIKLDDLASPDDNTDLDFSTTKHGLTPKGTNTGTAFLRDDGTWAVPASGSSKPNLQWTPAGNQPPASAYATPDTRNAHLVLDFDGSTDEEAVFAGVLPTGYSGGGLTCETWWAFTSATSGSLRVQAAIERMDVSSLDIDADSFAAFQSAGGTAPSTSGQFVKVTITFTDGAQMDSLAAGEAFRLKIRRDADGTSGTDDITTDAELLRIVLRET